jgi:hypothetical protein
MKHAAEMGSGAMRDMQTFTKTSSSIQKLIEGGYTHTYRREGDCISLLYASFVSRFIFPGKLLHFI